jgi:hypothetical protein
MSGLSARESAAAQRVAAQSKEAFGVGEPYEVHVLTDDDLKRQAKEHQAQVARREKMFRPLESSILPIVQKQLGDGYQSKLVAERIVEKIATDRMGWKDNSRIIAFLESLTDKSSLGSSHHDSKGTVDWVGGVFGE